MFFPQHQLCVYRKPTTEQTFLFSQYIIAGSLTIGAEKSLNKCLVSNVECLHFQSSVFEYLHTRFKVINPLTLLFLSLPQVKASLGMNVVATVTAGIGTVLYSVDAGVFYNCNDYDYYGLCYQYWV